MQRRCHTNPSLRSVLIKTREENQFRRSADQPADRVDRPQNPSRRTLPVFPPRLIHFPMGINVGSPLHKESEDTPSTPAPGGHLDPVRCAWFGEQTASAPFATRTDGARGGAKSSDGRQGLVRSAASLAAKRSHEVGRLCVVLLAAGRDVSRGYGAGEKGQDSREGLSWNRVVLIVVTEST